MRILLNKKTWYKYACLGRDIPPVSGSIIWARQIERQLETYLRRVEDVLGKGWQDHVEGQKLKEDGDAFKSQLDTKIVFDAWVSRVTQDSGQ